MDLLQRLAVAQVASLVQDRLLKGASDCSVRLQTIRIIVYWHKGLSKSHSLPGKHGWKDSLLCHLAVGYFAKLELYPSRQV